MDEYYQKKICEPEIVKNAIEIIMKYLELVGIPELFCKNRKHTEKFDQFLPLPVCLEWTRFIHK